MSSEWMKVMLEEIARKTAEEAADRAEVERRSSSPAKAPLTDETLPGLTTP